MLDKNGSSGFSVVKIRNFFMLSFLRKQESSLFADLLDSCFRRNDRLREFSIITTLNPEEQ